MDILIFIAISFADAAVSSAMPPSLSKPIGHYRQNTPFTQEQASRVVLKFGELKNLSDVRRLFSQQFFPKHPQNVPGLKAFQRIVERFGTEGTVHPTTPKGFRPTPDGDVDRVRKFFDDHPDSHDRGAAEQLGMSFGKVWKILRKKLKWKPYRPHLTTVLSPSNMEARQTTCSFWIKHEEDWFDKSHLD